MYGEFDLEGLKLTIVGLYSEKSKTYLTLRKLRSGLKGLDSVRVSLGGEIGELQKTFQALRTCGTVSRVLVNVLFAYRSLVSDALKPCPDSE